jgi:hypothetical protein
MLHVARASIPAERWVQRLGDLNCLSMSWPRRRSLDEKTAFGARSTDARITHHPQCESLYRSMDVAAAIVVVDREFATI